MPSRPSPVGSQLLCAALLRGRAAPVVGVVVFVVLTVGQFAGADGRLLDVVQNALMLLLVGLAAWSLRVSARPWGGRRG